MANSKQMSPRIQSLRDELVSRMPIQKTSDRATLAGKYITDVLIQYLTYKARMIRPRPRAVVIWPNVCSSSHYPNHHADVDRLKAEFEAGIDVNAALSSQVRRNVYAGDQPASTSGMTNDEWVKKSWKGKDQVRVLYDAHHLHLGTRLADGSVDRTGPLLFVGVTLDHAFFLTLGDHSSFDDGTISNLMWETLDAKAEADGGGVYMPPGGGETMGGTKMSDTFAAIEIVKTLNAIDQKLNKQNATNVSIDIDWEDIVIKNAAGTEIERFEGRL